jgi:hypothetical protein
MTAPGVTTGDDESTAARSARVEQITLREIEADMRCAWCGSQAMWRVAGTLSCSPHIANTIERAAQ